MPGLLVYARSASLCQERKAALQRLWTPHVFNCIKTALIQTEHLETLRSYSHDVCRHNRSAKCH